MSAVARLAKLKRRQFKPVVDTYVPVDMTEFFADLTILLIASYHGRKKPKESELAAFARALGVTVPKLWKLATTRPVKFSERLLAVSPNERDVDAVREAVIREFVRDEIHHQGAAGEFDNLTHALIAEVGWEMIWRGIERGVIRAEPARALCKVRPLQADRVP